MRASTCKKWRLLNMDKKVPLFEYETFTVRRPAKSVEVDDLPRKHCR